MRFSLRGLLAMTAFVAVGLMSLLHATAWVPNLWFTVLLLSVGVAVACWRAGKTAGFAEGYTLFAGGYALLLVSAWAQANPFMPNPNTVHTLLITHNLNDWVYERLLPLVREVPAPQATPGGGGFFGPGPIAQFGGAGNVPGFDSGLSLAIGSGQNILAYPDQTSFQRVAHCLWAVVIGCLGGRLMQTLRASTRDATATAP